MSAMEIKDNKTSTVGNFDLNHVLLGWCYLWDNTIKVKHPDSWVTLLCDYTEAVTSYFDVTSGLSNNSGPRVGILNVQI